MRAPTIALRRAFRVALLVSASHTFGYGPVDEQREQHEPGRQDRDRISDLRLDPSVERNGFAVGERRGMGGW